MLRTPLFLALPALAALTFAPPALAQGGAPTVEEVGDADSFGRTPRWLGLLSGVVTLAGDCTPAPGEPADPSCVVLNPAPATTTFRVDDLDVLVLPGRSTRSLLCHWQTPVASYSAFNPTGGPESFQFRVTPVYRIESAVLLEPGLADPNTGLPYNGVIELGLTSVFKFGTLAPGDSGSELLTGTRMCIGGLVSRASLVQAYGLSEAQADRFFREPVTIRLGISGSARLVESASINIGTRFVGD